MFIAENENEKRGETKCVNKIYKGDIARRKNRSTTHSWAEIY